MQHNSLTIEEIQATAGQIVEAAGQAGVQLDYRAETLPALETYLSVIVQAYGGLEKLQADRKLMPLVVSFALYFGETVRRAIGGRWIFTPEERMNAPFIRFDRTEGAAHTANLNVIATVHDSLHAPETHAITFAFMTYEKIYHGLPPYAPEEGSSNGNL